MGVTDVTKAIKNNQGKTGRNNKDIYFSGYDMLGGMIAALIITEVYDHVFGHQTIKKGILTGHPISNVGDGIKLDRLLVMLASAGLTAGEVFLNLKGGASAGAGMIIGYTYLDTSKQGNYIGQAKG